MILLIFLSTNIGNMIMFLLFMLNILNILKIIWSILENYKILGIIYYWIFLTILDNNFLNFLVLHEWNYLHKFKINKKFVKNSKYFSIELIIVTY